MPVSRKQGEEDVERLRKALEHKNMAARIYLYYGTSTEDYEDMVCLQMDGEFQYIRKEWE